MDWSDFFAMGGYAFYVWSAYGITALIITWEIVALIVKRRTQSRMELSVAGEHESST